MAATVYTVTVTQGTVNFSSAYSFHYSIKNPGGSVVAQGDVGLDVYAVPDVQNAVLTDCVGQIGRNVTLAQQAVAQWVWSGV